MSNNPLDSTELYDERQPLHGAANTNRDPRSYHRDFDITDCGAWHPTTSAGVALGVICYNPHPCQGTVVCAGCNEGPKATADDPMFVPCNCARAWHRSCFKAWRTGWVNPKNYWNCPDCMFSYHMHRLTASDIPSDTQRDIEKKIRFRIMLLWLAIIIVVGGCMSLLATISWASDKSNKNIPVAVKTLMSSLVFEFPNSNTTKEWREQFKDPDVRTWNYYGAWGAFLVSLVILVFSCIATTFCEEETGTQHRQQRGCCDWCCRGSSGSAGGDSCFWCWYWSSGPYSGTGYSNSCTCDCCSGGGGGNCCDSCNCSDGGGGCGDCKLDGAGEAALVIIAVVVVIVIISAIFVAIGLGLKKTHELQDSISTLIHEQQMEIENAHFVLAKDEFVRPINEV